MPNRAKIAWILSRVVSNTDILLTFKSTILGGRYIKVSRPFSD
eukprot:UN15703